jgi:hypothetical protein
MSQKKSQGVDPKDFFMGLFSLIKGIGLYIYYAWRESKYLSRVGLINLALLFVLIMVWSFKNTHFWMFHYFWPDIFTQQFVRDIGMMSWGARLFPMVILLFSIVVFILGHRSIRKIRAINKGLVSAGLKNAVGVHPWVRDLTNLTPYRQKLLIDTEGVPHQEFEKKRNYIRSCVNSQIEAIVERNEPKYLDLFLTNKVLTKEVPYANVCGKAIKPGEFVVGETYGRLVRQNLFDLPHMLVAGSTGMGKSYFLRQMVLNLLENTPNLQVFAIDLKEGVTMKPFKGLPNVKVVKDISEASYVLGKIRDEMKDRFKLLEKEGAEVIDPVKHKRDPILVVIDECSLLYSSSRNSEVGRKEAQKASEITDEIAKLSRAARIHLVLGTQKITKETVSTHIQENIEGRICFKVTSIQGSAMVVGTKVARDLPKIRGRAIAKFGVDIDEVQTPFIDKDDLPGKVAALQAEKKKEKSTNRQQMIDEKSSSVGDNKAQIKDVLTDGAVI